MKNSFFLYDEGTAPMLHAQELGAFLAQTFSAPAWVREEFISWHLAGLEEQQRRLRLSALAQEFAFLRVRRMAEQGSFSPPMRMETEMELRRLLNKNQGPSGIVYDGFHLQARLWELLSAQEAGLCCLHIILTNRLLATWGAEDSRYHLRAIILGQPAIISTSGLVEAPAKPREYYFLRQRLPGNEVSRTALRRHFAGRFLEESDPRLSEVAKGYLLQAAFYFLFGEAFCSDRDCRLFNAHWQEEMLHAQLRPEAGLCQRHEEMLACLGRM